MSLGYWLIIYFKKILTPLLWEIKKTVKILFFFSFPIKYFYKWMVNQLRVFVNIFIIIIIINEVTRMDIKIIKCFPLWRNPKIFNAEIIRNESSETFWLFHTWKKGTHARETGSIKTWTAKKQNNESKPNKITCFSRVSLRG